MNKKTWYEKNVPDQTGKVFVITGANSGIGFYSAQTLAGKNGTLILAVRDLAKGKSAKQNILAKYPQADIRVSRLDLTDLNSVHHFAEEFKTNFDKLDVLINNAGIMAVPYYKTKDGFEAQMGTNHFGHFVLTALLFSLLKRSSNARIISVSSALHKYGNIDFGDINWEKRKYDTWLAYADSKIANLHFTFSLAKKIRDKKLNLLAVAAHPGWAFTKLQRNKTYANILSRLFAQSGEMGSLPLIYAAVGENVNSGDYFGPDKFGEIRGFPKRANTILRAHNEEISNRLWEISEQLTQINFEF